MDPGLSDLQAQYRGGEGHPADGAWKEQKEPIKGRRRAIIFFLLGFIIPP